MHAHWQKSSSSQHWTAGDHQFQAKDLRLSAVGEAGQRARSPSHTHTREHTHQETRNVKKVLHLLLLLMNSNKAPDVGFTEGPGCWITSLGPARLQIHCGYFPRRPAFPQPTATIGSHAYGTKPQSRGPQVKVTSHRALNWLCKVLYRDQVSAHSTHESKVLVSPGNGFHLPFALSLVPDF